MNKLEFIDNKIQFKYEDYTILITLGSIPLYPADLQSYILGEDETIWNWHLFEVGERVYYSSGSEFAHYDFIVSSHDKDNKIIHLSVTR